MKIKYLYIICMLFSLAGCQEDEVDVYSGNPAISLAVINEHGRHDTVRNISYGFLEVKNDTNVDFLIKLEGLPVGYERKIKVVLSGDAIPGTDYELSTDVILPANAHEVRIPCLIKCDASLMNQTRTIILTAEPNEIFIKGFQLSSRIIISDGMPNQWIGGEYWHILGHCSRLKYRFMYDLLGYYDLSKFEYSELMMMATYLNKKVEEYNMNPDQFENKYGPVPMTDELGLVVQFTYEDPNWPL